MMTTKCLAFLLFFIFLKSTSAQVLSSLSARQIGQSVVISFTMKSGNTCNGIEILHSTDSIQFSKIGSIPGICGSATFDISYTYVDSFPVINTDNYYKLDLNVLGQSAVLKIHVFDQSKSLLIYPNPGGERINFYHTLNAKPSVNIRVFDLKGNLVVTMDDVRTNPAAINTDLLENGIYFLELIFDDTNKLESSFRILK